MDRDYIVKRDKYREAGVEEYWIIDEAIRKVTMLRLDARGRYRKVRPRDGAFHSEVLPGFWFRPEWFWLDPLPKKADIVKEILSSSD